MEKQSNSVAVRAAEKTVLSCILHKGDISRTVIDLDSIDVDVFVNPVARRVFQAIKLTKPEQTPDGRVDFNLVDVMNKVNETSTYDEVEACNKYVSQLPSIRAPFTLVTELTFLQANKVDRRMKELAKDMRQYHMTPDGFEDQISLGKEQFKDICDSHHPTLKFFTAYNAVSAGHNASIKYKESGGIDCLKSGYKRLDEILKDLRGGQLIVIASRPGIGKTTLALNLLKNNFDLLKTADKESKAVGFFSLEMHIQELITKLIAITAGRELSIVKSVLEGKEAEPVPALAIEKAKKTIGGLNILFCDDTTVTAGNIVSHVKAWIRKYKLKLVVIDYLQLISSPSDKRLDSYQQYQKIGMISRSLKLLAMEMDVCIVALAQLNRKVEERRALDKAPILSDLRESGSIEQDADVVMFLYEEKLEDFEKDIRGKEKTTVIKVAKNRNGPTGSIEFDFIKRTGRFVEMG